MEMCDQEIIPQACHGWLCGFGILQKNAQLGFVLSCSLAYSEPQPVKLNWNKKLDPKQKTIQALNIDAYGFRKTRYENPPTWEKEDTS